MPAISRRDSFRLGIGMAFATGLTNVEGAVASEPEIENDDQAGPLSSPFLTPSLDFIDVSRGDPVPHSLQGEALKKAGLTSETWTLEIVADSPAKLDKPLCAADGNPLTFEALLKLGESKGVLFLKAMQCTNIAFPLGQGLWEGVPLRDVLRLCGKMKDVRRVYYWGFHNDDPKQMFRSSLAINQVLDTPPGDLPPFLAYKLNGEPIPLERGGPVRMVVPWAHGFKSIKWLRHIVLTNDYQTNDTYALANNDPESYLKTAAYLNDGNDATYNAGQTIKIEGTAMVGWPGLERVEYWLRPVDRVQVPLSDDDPAWLKADWRPCKLAPAPGNLRAELPPAVAVDSRRINGFGPDGKPLQWPLRFSVVHWEAVLDGLKPGRYEFRPRSVDRNGFAQPEPRPFAQRSGLNGIQRKQILVVTKT